MIVVDASVLIAHLDQNDVLHNRAKTALLATFADELFVSTLTMAEVLVGPTRSGQVEVARSAMRRLDVHEVAVPEGAGSTLARLRSETGLKLPDCCVLLAAQQMGASGVLSFDEKLLSWAVRLGYEDSANVAAQPNPEPDLSSGSAQRPGE